jgi:hypothetical protein
MVVLGVFMVAAGKRPVYLLPAAPALALLAGRMLAGLVTPATDALRDAEPLAWKLPLTRLLVAIAIFDIGTLVTFQLVRESKARRGSVVAFARKVAAIVPGDAPLPADPSIHPSDRMVFAYRLRRPIPRDTAVTPGLPYLVPAAARLGKWCASDTLLAESGDGANDFALMRAAAPGAGRRTSAFCSATDQPAGFGGVAATSPQDLAGKGRRLLLPLGDLASDPSPAPAPSVGVAPVS